MVSNTAPLSVLLVGAGVAGCSAAAWLHEFCIPFTWIEASNRLGGTLHSVHNPLPQLPGFSFPHGAAMCKALQQQTSALSLEPQFQTRVLSLYAPNTSAPIRATCQRHDKTWDTHYRAVLLATGTERRSLGFEEETTHLGRGVARSGRAERGRFANRSVTIVGGGDAALENALLLAEVNARVTVVHRSGNFQARPEFLRAAQQHPHITLRTHTTLFAIEAQPNAPYLTAITVQTPTGKERLETQGLLVRIGVGALAPEIFVAGRSALRDEAGYLSIDNLGRTVHPNILAAGDCTCPDFRTVSIAAAQGAQAAKTISRLFADSTELTAQ